MSVTDGFSYLYKPMLAKFGKTISTCRGEGELGTMGSCFSFSPREITWFAERGEIVLVGFGDLLDEAKQIPSPEVSFM